MGDSWVFKKEEGWRIEAGHANSTGSPQQRRWEIKARRKEKTGLMIERKMKRKKEQEE